MVHKETFIFWCESGVSLRIVEILRFSTVEFQDFYDSQTYAEFTVRRRFTIPAAGWFENTCLSVTTSPVIQTDDEFVEAFVRRLQRHLVDNEQKTQSGSRVSDLANLQPDGVEAGRQRQIG